MAFQYGITPARAGKRISLSREPSMRRDHPRVGGEKSLDLSLVLVV